MELLSELCGFLVSITIIIGFPVGIIWMIVSIVKKKNKKMPRNILIGCFVSIIFFTLIGSTAWSKTDVYKKSIAENENTDKDKDVNLEIETDDKIDKNQNKITQENENKNTEVEKDSETQIESEIEEGPEIETKTELTEEEYKSLCEELYYNDIFFGDKNLEGQYVKLHLFISESYYYEADALYGSSYTEYYEKYKIQRDFYKCCVMREETKDDTIPSYVGSQITMWFSGNYDLKHSDYKSGQKIIVYAEVVSWSNNTWDGYNSVTIIPKYIEFE